MDTLKPTLTEAAPQPFPPLEISSISEIESWYRSLRPDRDMSTIPTVVHVDALASSILLLTDREPPDTTRDRIEAVLNLTTDMESLGRSAALSGPTSLLITDLVVELSERGEKIPAPVERSLLAFGGRIAQEVRDDPHTSTADRIKANTRLANTETASLQAKLRRGEISEEAFSDAYIQIVRKEAKWMADHSRDAPVSLLFEGFIGGLTRYQAWTTGVESELTVRHATLREDSPSPKSEGGSGFQFAHDIHVASPAGKALLQCKWGPNSVELQDVYRQNSVVFVSDETRGFIKGFQNLAGSSNFENIEACDRWVQRYHLDRIIDSAGLHPPFLAGRGTVALAAKA
jgi:hypothetical protein